MRRPVPPPPQKQLPAGNEGTPSGHLPHLDTHMPATRRPEERAPPSATPNLPSVHSAPLPSNMPALSTERASAPAAHRHTQLLVTGPPRD